MVKMCAVFWHCLLWLDAIDDCVYMAQVCFMSLVVNVGMFVVYTVAGVVEDSGVLSLGVLKYVVCLRRGGDGCCIFCEFWVRFHV